MTLRRPADMPGMEEVPRDTLHSVLGESVHTGLRKGTDAEDAHDLWLAISRSDTSAWSDAVLFAVTVLQHYGWKVYRPEGQG